MNPTLFDLFNIVYVAVWHIFCSEMADKALKSVLRIVGFTEPLLTRRLPLSSQDLKGISDKLLNNHNILDGMSVRTISLTKDSENLAQLAHVITDAGGVVSNSSEKCDAVVCDTRGISRPDQLHFLFTELNPIISTIKKNGRLVLIGGDTASTTRDVGSATVTEAVGGFAKAIAQELGVKGITANSLQIPNQNAIDGSSPESGAIQFFLSKRSSFISGQVGV
jgi:hypothetical protein